MHSSADMSFLTIPSQEGLFKTIKTSKSAGEAEGRSRTDAAEENDDEEDEDDDDNDDVRLIPRCSPVPRKRGASIFDETAEYMRIHQALSAGKRVSFADTTGGDLVDVREFAAFDSDEEDSAKWQEEEAKYRKADREPTYRVHPEFIVPSSCSVLLRAVRSNKVEVERISPMEDEPLAFSGIIRVLNISFHKAVYIRSTMDSWITYFDHPAEYVLGSNDGDTDQFSFKLSFAPPYTTHGSRIEFVVRYETSVGDYWANNFSMNYAVTLLLSYEGDPSQTSIDMTQKRSILKSPKVYSLMSEKDQEKGEAEEPESLTAELVRPVAVCPVIIHPEIDMEKPVHQSRSSVTSLHRPPSTSATPSTPAAPSASSKPDLHPNAAFAVQPEKSQHSPHQERESQTPEQSVRRRPTALPSPSRPSSQEPEQRSDESQADRVKTVPRFCPPAARMNLVPAAGDKRMAAAYVPCPSLREEATFRVRQLQGRILIISTMSTEHQANRRPAAEATAPLEAEDEVQPPANAAEPSHVVAPPSAPFTDPLGLLSEEDNRIDLLPCIIFLSVSLSLVCWNLFRGG